MSRVPMPEAWVDPWSCTMVEKTLMRAPSIRLGFLVNNQAVKTPERAPSIRLGALEKSRVPMHTAWIDSWSMTKQSKPLDKPRAPGKVQGTHAYGMD
jgi:hypothetical protein